MNIIDAASTHRTNLFLVAFSVVLAILLYVGILKGSYWVAAIPVVYAWVRVSLFHLISESVYHAHHRFEDDMVQRDTITVHDAMTAAVTLDADSFLRNLRADDEAAGCA